jgi:hypothetical protein
MTRTKTREQKHAVRPQVRQVGAFIFLSELIGFLLTRRAAKVIEGAGRGLSVAR